MSTLHFACRRLFPTEEDTRSVLAGPAVVATFATRDEAEAECSRRERECRGRTSPFDLYQGCLGLLTSLSPALLRDWVQDAGIEPPAEGEDWEAWWDAN